MRTVPIGHYQAELSTAAGRTSRSGVTLLIGVTAAALGPFAAALVAVTHGRGRL